MSENFISQLYCNTRTTQVMGVLLLGRNKNKDLKELNTLETKSIEGEKKINS